MNSSRLKYEGWLYGLAFLIALGFRLIQLGATPLTDSEATFAMQALNISRGASPLLGPQPAYILLTSILFAVIKSTNFMARLIPALVGSALVFTPYFFREQLKPRPALMLAFFFAIDPGLVSLSRLAGGTILAVTFSLFAVGMWTYGRRLIAAGIFAGFALLSGTSLWAGLLTIGLAWLFIRGVESISKTNQPPVSDSRLLLTNYQFRPALLSLIITLVLGGTLFLLAPNGLSAWVSSLPAYLKGWVSPSTMTPGRILFTLFVNIFASERLEVGIVTTALLILLTYIWFDISAIGLDPFNQYAASIPVFGSVQNPRYAILYGAIAILITCIAFVAFGWSARTAWLGSAWAFILFLAVYTLGAAWGGSGMRYPNGVELWTLDQKPAQSSLLLSSVDELSDHSLGHEQSQPVTIMGINSPALEWLLRNHEVKLISALDPQSAPPLIITPPMDNLSLPSAYRGEGFIWRQRVQYESMKRAEWWRWLINRQLPRENETIILWARDDLFPDARQNSQ